jgi:heptosyltransferase III
VGRAPRARTLSCHDVPQKLTTDDLAYARFLVIRRDNIGDLVCTTPLIALLRERFPNAHIAALVNGYNKDVLAGNPHLDAIHHYTKGKHAHGKMGIWKAHLDRVMLIWRLRRQRFDVIILGNSTFQAGALRFARLIGARHIIGYAANVHSAGAIDTVVEKIAGEVIHEVLAVNRLLRPLGIDGPSPPVRVYPQEHQVQQLRRAMELSEGAQVIGIHISARLPQGRWQLEKFVTLIERLSQAGGAQIFLFWSPGGENNALHPGDDAKAQAILDRCGKARVRACPTHELEDLIVGLSLCQTVICSDGGAMHIAAGLNKKIVALFGADPDRWHPWQADHKLLTSASREVSDISVEEVMAAYRSLSAVLEVAAV